MASTTYSLQHHTPDPGQPELTNAWRVAFERGIAGALCDRIVREREIPDRLVDALCAAFESEDGFYQRQTLYSERTQAYKVRLRAA